MTQPISLSPPLLSSLVPLRIIHHLDPHSHCRLTLTNKHILKHLTSKTSWIDYYCKPPTTLSPFFSFSHFPIMITHYLDPRSHYHLTITNKFILQHTTSQTTWLDDYYKQLPGRFYDSDCNDLYNSD